MEKSRKQQEQELKIIIIAFIGLLVLTLPFVIWAIFTSDSFGSGNKNKYTHTEFCRDTFGSGFYYSGVGGNYEYLICRKVTGDEIIEKYVGRDKWIKKRNQMDNRD